MTDTSISEFMKKVSSNATVEYLNVKFKRKTGWRVVAGIVDSQKLHKTYNFVTMSDFLDFLNK